MTCKDSAIQDARNDVFNAETILSNARQKLDKALCEPCYKYSTTQQILDKLSYYKIVVKEEGSNYIYLTLKGQDGIRAQSSLGAILDEVGFYIGCVVICGKDIELRLFKRSC